MARTVKSNGIESLLVQSDENLNCSVMFLSLSSSKDIRRKPRPKIVTDRLNSAPKLADADKALAIVKALQITLIWV